MRDVRNAGGATGNAISTSGGDAPNNIEYALLALLAFLWGSSYLLIKVAVVSIPPLTLIAMRVSIAAAFLGLVMRFQGASLPRDAQTWKMLLVQAFLNSIGAWTVLAWGQQFVDSGLAGVLNSTSPIFVFFLTAAFVRHEAVSWMKLAGAMLGVLGVTLIVGPSALAGLGTNVAAQLAVLAGALMYAGAAIYGKRFAHLSATVTSAGTMIWASLWLVPLSLIVDEPWTLSPSWQSVLAAAVLAVFCTGGALLIYFRLVCTLGAMGVASQSYLRAGISVALGIVVLGEQVTPMIAVGLLAAVLGVAMINARKR